MALPFHANYSLDRLGFAPLYMGWENYLKGEENRKSGRRQAREVVYQTYNIRALEHDDCGGREVRKAGLIARMPGLERRIGTRSFGMRTFGRVVFGMGAGVV